MNSKILISHEFLNFSQISVKYLSNHLFSIDFCLNHFMRSLMFYALAIFKEMLLKIKNGDADCIKLVGADGDNFKKSGFQSVCTYFKIIKSLRFWYCLCCLTGLSACIFKFNWHSGLFLRFFNWNLNLILSFDFKIIGFVWVFFD